MNGERNVILAFDDGRKDIYNIAFPIMKKNNIIGSLYIITGTLNNSYTPIKGFASGKRQFISLENILEMEKEGFEISSHSCNHSNEYSMIKESLDFLCNKGIMKREYKSFSSPRSEINEKNFEKSEIKKLDLKYLRTGIQIRNENIFMKLMFILQKKCKSKIAFYLLNKDNIMKNRKEFFIKTIAIRSYNTINQINFLLNKIKQNETAVLLFHSITNENEEIDEWGFNKIKFEKLCKMINDKNINNLTVKEFCEKYNNYRS